MILIIAAITDTQTYTHNVYIHVHAHTHTYMVQLTQKCQPIPLYPFPYAPPPAKKSGAFTRVINLATATLTFELTTNNNIWRYEEVQQWHLRLKTRDWTESHCKTTALHFKVFCSYHHTGDALVAASATMNNHWRMFFRSSSTGVSQWYSWHGGRPGYHIHERPCFPTYVSIIYEYIHTPKRLSRNIDKLHIHRSKMGLYYSKVAESKYKMDQLSSACNAT